MKTRLEVTIDENRRCNTVLTDEIVAILLANEPTVIGRLVIQHTQNSQMIATAAREVIGATLRAGLEKMRPKPTVLVIGDERTAGPWR